jgi:hypothetical protein
MDVNRHGERGSALQNGQEGRVVQKAPAGRAEDHGAFQSERTNRTFEFIRGGSWLRHRQSGKRGKASGMSSDGGGYLIVGLLCQPHPLISDPLDCGWPIFREHLEIDAARVHLLQSQGAEVSKPGLSFRRHGRGWLPAASLAGGIPLHNFSETPGKKVLFYRNSSHNWHAGSFSSISLKVTEIVSYSSERTSPPSICVVVPVM